MDAALRGLRHAAKRGLAPAPHSGGRGKQTLCALILDSDLEASPSDSSDVRAADWRGIRSDVDDADDSPGCGRELVHVSASLRDPNTLGAWFPLFVDGLRYGAGTLMQNPRERLVAKLDLLRPPGRRTSARHTPELATQWLLSVASHALGSRAVCRQELRAPQMRRATCCQDGLRRLATTVGRTPTCRRISLHRHASPSARTSGSYRPSTPCELQCQR